MIRGGPRGIPLTVNFFGFLKIGIELSWTRISFMAQAGPVMVAGGIGYSKEKGLGAELGVGVEDGPGIYVSVNRRDGIVIDTPFGNKKLLNGNTESDKLAAEIQKMKAANQAYLNFLIDLNSSGKQMKDGHCLVIFGLLDIDNNVWNDVVYLLQKLHSSLEKSDLDFAFRFGVYQKRKQRPVIVQISRKSVRQIVLDNKHKLTGSGVEIKDDVKITVFFDD